MNYHNKISLALEQGARRTYMLICLRRDDSDEFYCITTSEKSEQKSDCNYRKKKNCQRNFSFKIIRDLFLMNCEFAFDIRRGANLRSVLKP